MRGVHFHLSYFLLSFNLSFSLQGPPGPAGQTGPSGAPGAPVS